MPTLEIALKGKKLDPFLVLPHGKDVPLNERKINMSVRAAIDQIRTKVLEKKLSEKEARFKVSLPMQFTRPLFLAALSYIKNRQEGAIVGDDIRAPEELN